MSFLIDAHDRVSPVVGAGVLLAVIVALVVVAWAVSRNDTDRFA